jgi:hypothetical protein
LQAILSKDSFLKGDQRGITPKKSPKLFAASPANTLICDLNRNDVNISPWKGSGKYDLWLYEGTSTLKATTIYKADSIDIPAGPITVDFNSFTKVQ